MSGDSYDGGISNSCPNDAAENEATTAVASFLAAPAGSLCEAPPIATAGRKSGKASGQKRKSSAAEEERTDSSGSSNDQDLKVKIREWADKANISFNYTADKIDKLVKEAKKKMNERPKKLQQHNSNMTDSDYHLECTACKERFPDEDGLSKHFKSEEHLVKVREKSETKTLGDLKIFESAREKIVRIVMKNLREAPPFEEHPQGDTEPSSPAAKLPGSLTTEPIGDWDFSLNSLSHEEEEENAFKALLEDFKESNQGLKNADIPTQELSETYEQLKERSKKLEDENNKLKEQLKQLREQLKQNETKPSSSTVQKIVLEVKKSETKGGYRLDNALYHRIMHAAEQHYSSIEELVLNLVACSVTTNRNLVACSVTMNGGKKYKDRKKN